MRRQNAGEQVVPHRPPRFAAARRDALGTALLFAPGFVIYLAFMVLPMLLFLHLRRLNAADSGATAQRRRPASR